MARDRSQAMDHVVVVMFENRSLDNVLGHLYGPDDGKNFEGVIGKGLSNPIPDWAEHGADRQVVPYTVAMNMDTPNPDSGEEYPHTNTQLYNILNEANRFKAGGDVGAPYNAPEPGQTPTMDGFVTDYISYFTAETGRQPTYDEYSQIMTGYTPEQIPVLNGLARAFGVFDHWFCEVPSQTLPNRSFWTAATSSGFAFNSPMLKFVTGNDAETIFDRLDAHGRTWRVYVTEPQQFSATGVIHFQRLKDRFATHFVPFSQFESDAASGDLPDFSFIEPCLTIGHNDYHPALGRSEGHGVDIPGVDPPSSILGGEALLARVYDAYRGMQSDAGSNVWNTTLLIGWDEPGGTYDHVPPPAVRHRTHRPRSESWASGSIGRAIGFRRSSCRHGSRRVRSSTRSTATRRSSRPFVRSGSWATRSPGVTPRPGPSRASSRSTRRATRWSGRSRHHGPCRRSPETTPVSGRPSR